MSITVTREFRAVEVILFKESGKYYTAEYWEILDGALGPFDMIRSKDFRRIGGGAVLVRSQEPWGYPHLFPSEVAESREDRTPPLPGQIYQTVAEFDSYEAQTGRFETLDPSEAHVTTSLIAEPGGLDAVRLGRHKLVIDLDLPAKLIPSSTPGHFHLYVDHEIQQDKYFALLEALADAGLIEPGYLGASLERGFTAVRLPWVRKEDAAARAEAVRAEEGVAA